MTRQQGFALGILVGLSTAGIVWAAIYLIDIYAN